MYRERLKLMHACIFFAENCANVGRKKLYKLLFLLDFVNHRNMGRSVTGLNYSAWERGPVPPDFHNEWENSLSPDIATGLRPEQVTRRFNYDIEDEGRYEKGYETKKLVPRIKFDENVFSPRELVLMTDLAKKYFNKSANEMEKSSHEAFGYWDEIWHKRNQHYAPIPYELVFDRQNTPHDQVIREFANETKRFVDLSR